MMIRSIFLLAFLFFVSICFSSPVSGFYFYLSEGVKRCYIEEVPEDVLVVGKYTSFDYQRLLANPNNGNLYTYTYHI